MHWFDLLLIAAYFAGVAVLGLGLRRRAAESIDSYFLGSKRMSWWLLGASGMASNVDMAGTMLIASLIFLFGFQGFYIELRGGIVLVMAFYLALLGKWTRRSNCMTVAEWMQFRFGPGPQGQLPRLVSAVGNLVFFAWTIAYFAAGSTKFLAVFLPWNPVWCSAGLILIVMLYTACAGLHAVVWTDVLQGGLILFMAVYLAIKAFITVDPEFIRRTVGESWMSLAPAWEITPPVGYEAYRLLGVGIIFYLVKTTIDGLSGAGGYIAQRYFSARNERECRRLSLFWIVLMAVRWPMVMAVALLGLTVRDRIDDAEMVLPVVLQEVVPDGLRGLMIVALLAAAMSTYSSIMNAGASYFARDLYQAFLRRRAGQRELVLAGAGATCVCVAVGLLMVYKLPRVNDLWAFLNMGLGVGLLVPNFLRWYWWRLNGYGYAAGVAAGMTAAIAQQSWFPDLPEYTGFAIVAAVAAAAMIVTSLVTPPVPIATTQEFYERTRPFGCWGPIRDRLEAASLKSIRRENRRDLTALVLAVPWQMVLFLLPMTALLRRWGEAGVLAILLAVLSLGLRAVWSREDADRGGASAPQAAASAG